MAQKTVTITLPNGNSKTFTNENLMEKLTVEGCRRDFYSTTAKFEYRKDVIPF